MFKFLRKKIGKTTQYRRACSACLVGTNTVGGLGTSGKL